MILKKIKSFLVAATVFTLCAGMGTAAFAAEGSGIVTTLAGAGGGGSQDGGLDSAQFNLPEGLLMRNGELFVFDTYNNLIRSVTEADVKVYAGSIRGLDGHRYPKGYFVDGYYDEALFNRPTGGAAVGKRGNIYIADSENHAIRSLTGKGVYTYAGGRAGYADGNLKQAKFNHPSAIAIDGAGSLYIADTLNHCVRKIDKKGKVTTLAGTPKKETVFSCPSGIAVSEDGSVVYVSDTGNNRVCKIEDGEVTVLAGDIGDTSILNLPAGLALADGALIVADCGNNRIRAISNDGEIITIAGDGEPGDVDGEAETARLHMPKGVFADDGVLYIADTGNNKIKRMALDNGLFE